MERDNLIIVILLPILIVLFILCIWIANSQYERRAEQKNKHWEERYGTKDQQNLENKKRVWQMFGLEYDPSLEEEGRVETLPPAPRTPPPPPAYNSPDDRRATVILQALPENRSHSEDDGDASSPLGSGAPSGIIHPQPHTPFVVTTDLQQPQPVAIGPSVTSGSRHIRRICGSNPESSPPSLNSASINHEEAQA